MSREECLLLKQLGTLEIDQGNLEKDLENLLNAVKSAGEKESSADVL